VKTAEANHSPSAQQVTATLTDESSPTAAIPVLAAETTVGTEQLNIEVEAARGEAERGTAKPAAGSDANDARPNEASLLFAARQDKSHETDIRGEGLTEAERVRFVQRVARAFHSVGDEGGEVRLRLSPPELGSLRLELSVRDGVMSARLEAETAAARNLLLDNLPVLRERLAEQNVKVEQFDVDVRDEQRQPARDDFAGQTDLPRQPRRDRQRAHESRPATVAMQRIIRGAANRSDSGELNVLI
jgi:flagellar hook-length control protein FliK